MRTTMMTLALAISSLTACAIDTTSTEHADIPAIDSPTDGVRAQLGERCTSNNDCESFACDIVSRTCVTPEDGDAEQRDDAPAHPIDGMDAALEHSSCTQDSDCFNGACDEDYGICRYYPF